MDKKLTGYLAAETIEEALSFYAGYGPGEVCWLAGGTDLKLPVSRSYLAAVDIKGIQALRGMSLQNNGALTLGALTTVQEIEENSELRRYFPVIVEAARQFGSRQVRERGTVGGNICNGSPTADLATALLSLDAVLCWQSADGEVRETLSQYYRRERGQRRDKKGYLLEKIEIDPSLAQAGGTYLKLGERGALEIGLASAAVVVQCEGDVITEARISLGGVAGSPLRALKAEAMLRGGRTGDHNLFTEAGRMASSECAPLTDASAGAEYRREMVRVLVRRGLEEVLRKDGSR